jgi:alkaline phosphatase
MILRNRYFLVLVALFIGAFVGFKLTETFAVKYIMENLPIDTATLDEKDVYVTEIEDGIFANPKELTYIDEKAKNIILLIADGMSLSQITAYRMMKGSLNERISMDNFPYSGIVLTHSYNAAVTDSASSATAYSTGFKTNNGVLGLDKDLNVLENLTETIDKFGFVSSLISTSEVTHATPAAFASHVDLRWKTDIISSQMIDSKVATILGGGRYFFIPEEEGGKREDGINLLNEINQSHILLTQKNDLSNISGSLNKQVLGLFADEHLRDEDKKDNHKLEPSLAEMLEYSVSRSNLLIDQGCAGFFVMAEGSQVDWAGHSNDFDYLIREMEDFDEAVDLALEIAKERKDTLVVVTSDHEVGGLLIEPSNPIDNSLDEVKFSFNTAVGGGTHTGVPVPVYAYGPGSENFTGTLDNTDIYYAMLAALDLDNKNGTCLSR